MRQRVPLPQHCSLISHIFAALQNRKAYSATVMSGLYSPSGSAMSRQSPLSSPTLPLTQTSFLLVSVVLCPARIPDRRLYRQ